MKYICLGYFDEKKWETTSQSEQNAYLDECFAYDDELRKNGHWVAGGERSKAPGTASPCDGRTAKCLSPMARTPRRKNSWADSACSKRAT